MGRLDAPGRPILFGTSEEFLRCFNLSSLSELPDVELEYNFSGLSEELAGEEAVAEDTPTSDFEIKTDDGE